MSSGRLSASPANMGTDMLSALATPSGDRASRRRAPAQAPIREYMRPATMFDAEYARRMIEIVSGNLLESPAKALVNPVNIVGVMGAGLAKQFKEAFPEMFDDYCLACSRGWVNIGDPHYWITPDGRWIVNFPTKRHWRHKSRLSYVRAGLHSLLQEVDSYDLKSVAIPALGCGHGGLRWADVRPLIENTFRPWPDVHVYLYPPHERT